MTRSSYVYTQGYFTKVMKKALRKWGEEGDPRPVLVEVEEGKVEDGALYGEYGNWAACRVEGILTVGNDDRYGVCTLTNMYGAVLGRSEDETNLSLVCDVFFCV